MKNMFLNQSMALITKYNNNYNEEEKEKLRYGLEGIYLMITKSIIIVLIALLLNMLKELLIILLLTNIIRFFAFGFHAKTNTECLFVSSFLYIVIPLTIFYLNPNKLIQITIAIISTITIMIFSPADTVKRPLPNKKKRIIRKTISSIIALIYTIIICTTNTMSELLLCALIIQMINVNPLIYMLFKQPYKNYKKYQTN